VSSFHHSWLPVSLVAVSKVTSHFTEAAAACEVSIFHSSLFSTRWSTFHLSSIFAFYVQSSDQASHFRSTIFKVVFFAVFHFFYFPPSTVFVIPTFVLYSHYGYMKIAMVYMLLVPATPETHICVFRFARFSFSVFFSALGPFL